MGVGVGVDPVAHPRSVLLKHQKTQQRMQLKKTQQRRLEWPQQPHRHQQQRQRVGEDVDLVAHPRSVLLLHARQNSRTRLTQQKKEREKQPHRQHVGVGVDVDVGVGPVAHRSRSVLLK